MAAKGRDRSRIQQRAQAGPILKRAVGMPQLIASLVHPLTADFAPDFTVGAEVGYICETDAEAVWCHVSIEHAIDLHGTEFLCEFDMLLGREVLLRKYQYRVFPECLL